MPVVIGDVLTDIVTTSMTFLGAVISGYWPYILGLIVLVGLAYRFKRSVGIAR